MRDTWCFLRTEAMCEDNANVAATSLCDRSKPAVLITALKFDAYATFFIRQNIYIKEKLWLQAMLQERRAFTIISVKKEKSCQLDRHFERKKTRAHSSFSPVSPIRVWSWRPLRRCGSLLWGCEEQSRNDNCSGWSKLGAICFQPCFQDWRSDGLGANEANTAIAEPTASTGMLRVNTSIRLHI